MNPDEAEDAAVQGAYWSLDEHISGALAEALVAEQQHRLDPMTIWHGPHTRLKDVSRGAMTIDAKAAWLTPDAVWFMGSGRELEVRAGVTHYALVVLDAASTAVRLIAPRQGGRGLDVHGHIQGLIYLVEAAVINEHARPALLRDGSPGNGRNLVLPREFAPKPFTA